MKAFISCFIAVILLASNTGVSTEKEVRTERKATVVMVEQQTSQLALEDRTDIGTIEYDNKGRISKADSLVYSEWEKYVEPQIIYTVLTQGTDYYEYGKNDLLERVSRKSDAGDVLFTVDYEYNDDNSIKTETYKKGDKTVVSSYQYNDDGSIQYIYRDDGERTVEYKYYYHGDGTFKGIRQKYSINSYTLLDWLSTVNLDSDGNVISIIVQSGNMLDESTAFYFTYNENGEIDNVSFVQGYFQVSYKISYNYSNIEVLK